jgi:hypothetical protein
MKYLAHLCLILFLAASLTAFLPDATRIVPATGERTSPPDAADFTPVFRALAEEIRSSYVLSWYLEERDGRAHELRVMNTRPGVQLRASRTTFVSLEN